MSDTKRVVLLRIAGLCGVITPIIVLSLISLAVSYSTWFSWTQNALSDLGIHEVAILFNSSLMIGGVLALIFDMGLMQILRQSRLGFIGTFALQYKGVAIPEMLASLATSAWSIVMGIKLYKQAK